MKKNKQRKIGIAVDSPKKDCNDKHCPFHSPFSIHGRSFEGSVIQRNTHKTVTISIPFLRYIPKYERYEKRLTKIKAHNPNCQNAQLGDHVKVYETRPISKTKNFVVIKVDKK